MKLPLQVVFRDLVPLPSLEGRIRTKVAKLEQFLADPMSCQVVVEVAGNRHHRGLHYVVRIDLRVTGQQIVAGEHQGNEDLEVALRDAFDAITRRLQDHARRRRGQVKQHGPADASSDAGAS